MRLKHLQSALSSVSTPQFPDPNITLEQYATSPALTSHIILAALQNEDLGPELSMLDLGCGTAMLSIGAALVGCSSIMCVDCDESAMAVAIENVTDMGLEECDEDGDGACSVEFLLAKVNHSASLGGGGGGGRGGRGGRGNGKGGRGKGGKKARAGRGGRDFRSSLPEQASSPLEPPQEMNPVKDGIPLASNCVDTVLTNPPFGTKHNAGIDVSFLRTAIRLARRSVYSFHKTSTRSYLIKTVESWGYQVEVCAQMKFDIPKLYKFHTKDNVDVDVDLIRVVL